MERAGTYLWVVTGIMLSCSTLFVNGQQLELTRTLEMFLDTFATEHVAIALEGDVLAVSRCTPAGGEVRLHARNVGGADQWESFGVINDPRRGFGFSLDLDQGRLAIGIRGGITWDSAPGAVQVLEVDPANIISPVIDHGEFIPNNGLPSDRFGHSVLWHGGSLFVGATGRSHAEGSGAVYVFSWEQGTLTETGMLQPDPIAFQLPALGKFGAGLACNGLYLAITSPRSGFGVPSLATGAIHLYKRNPASPTGWSALSDLYRSQVSVEPDPSGFGSIAYLDENDLGREGLFLSDSTLLVHFAGRYYVQEWNWSEYAPRDEDGDIMPLLDPACVECGVQAYRLDASGSWSEYPTGTWPGDGVARSRKGWAWNGEQAYVTSYDSTLMEWNTEVYLFGEGSSSWLPEAVLPGTSPCDVYNGPISTTRDRMVRTAMRSGVCAPMPNGKQVFIEVFDRPGQVGIVGLGSANNTFLHVSPSPASDHCQLAFPDAGPWKVTVHTIRGELVGSGALLTGPSATLDLHAFGPGVYLLRAEHVLGANTLVGRLVVY